MDNDMMEVYFDRYCPKCEHFDKSENEDPCNDCMANPVNTNSHKPVYYRERG